MCIDALTANKYYYFIRLMGHKAPHVALECALKSHPNMIILGEEVATSKKTLDRRMVKQKNGRWKFLYNRKEKILKMPCGFHFGLLRNVT